MGQHIAKFKRSARTPQAAITNIETALERKTPAPRHPSTVKKYDDLVQANPDFKIATLTKNEELHKRLESVRVDSEGVAPDMVLKPGKKQLENLRDGRLTYDEIEELFINRKVSPDVWNEQKIAEKYHVDHAVAENLLKYFSSLYIYKKDPVPPESLNTPFYLNKPDGGGALGPGDYEKK